MDEEKDTFVWHVFCSLVEDLSLRLAEYTNICDGGTNRGPIFDGGLIELSLNSPECLVKVVTLLNSYVFNIDLPYVIKEFDMPPFMAKILEQEKQIKTLEKKLAAKSQQVEFLVCVQPFFLYFVTEIQNANKGVIRGVIGIERVVKNPGMGIFDNTSVFFF